MRQDASFFGEQDLSLVYIAKRLKEALAVEERFTAACLDYLVEADSYVGGFLFRSERIGAFFYVKGTDAERARTVLRDNGWRPYQTPATETSG